MTTLPALPARTDRLLQLCARVRLEGGIWDGKRTLGFYQANGFDCDLGRARANLDRAAEQFPQLLTPVEGKRWTYEVPDNVSIHFPEDALETIADNRAFIAFAREKLNGAARTLRNDSGERQLLSGMKGILDAYEARHESAALSHSLSDDTGRVEGMRWSLESLLWARFGGSSSEYPVEWRP
ncbi:hypothetical protein [Streptomyces subrutilus]|uniref:Uncharacterized protein n=1 Tax=Streptomyces subrutilus TaxID=36818 RepID=A0A1E5NXZ0_9ACTN|nr:hypothetical protein [Streptomyces subrutilus]OEJ21083.1 hypothetical protein BGK67_34895 [Streptomyces subrutilus]